MTNLPTRIRKWATSLRRSEPGPEAEPTQTIEELRRTTAAAVVAMDDAIRASARELETARSQVGTGACERFARTWESARALADEALARHHEAADLAARDATDDAPERIKLSQVIDLARRVDELLEGDAEAFARLRDLRRRAPEMLDALAVRAIEVERATDAADDELRRLGDDHATESLVSLADNPARARELIAAARQLIDDGRAHLARDDRVAAVVAARGAEATLQEAQAETDEVLGARTALDTAREDVRAALASIRSDLADARRLRAKDPLTTAALERAHPVIASAETALAEGGDLLGALADLTTAEQAIDDALEEHRDADDQQRRAATRLERRVRNSASYISGVDRRLGLSTAGTADNRSAISRAGHLVEEARALLTEDPQAASARLDEAMGTAKAVQAEVDEATRKDALHYFAVEDQRSSSVGELAAGGLIGLLTLGWGGSSHGSSGGGLGGGGRF